MVFRGLIFFILCVSANNAFCINEPIIAEGSALMQGDPNKAKEEAMNNALESAVRNYLYTTYSKEAVDDNGWKLRKIYKNAKNFITSSKMIFDQKNTSIDVVNVKMEVVVDAEQIKEVLTENGISLTSQKISSVLPLIVERTSTNKEGESWWKPDEKGLMAKNGFSDVERSLAKNFAQNGFALIDPYENKLAGNMPESYKYMGTQTPELIKLGKLFDVGLIATGYIWTDCTKDEKTAQNACETNLSIQIISVDTGKVIAAKRTQETTTLADKEESRTTSRTKACKTVSDSILYQLVHQWDKQQTTNFKIIVKGIKDYQKYSSIRTCLAGGNITGLTNVMDRYQMNKVMIFESDLRGSIDTVQSNITSKCFTDSKVQITNKGSNFIEINVL